MQEVDIKVSEFETMEEIHEYLAQELDFPSYYGKNLSALYDVLTDLSEDTRISLNLENPASESLLEEAQRMAEVLCDAAMENETLEVEITEYE